MKNLFKLMSLALVASMFLFTSCGGDEGTDGGDPSVETPTSLKAESITQTSAILSWEGVETTFEVTVNGKTEVVTEKTFVANGLIAGTEYSWKVRAKKDDKFSSYAEAKFTTTTAPSTGIAINFGGETWTATTLYGQETDEGAFWLGRVFAGDDVNSYPWAQVWPEPTVAANVTLDPAQEEMFFCYATANDRLLQTTSGQIVGDWMFQEGSYTIEAYSLDGITASFDLVLFDGYAKYVDEATTFDTKEADYTMTDVALTPMPTGKMFNVSKANFEMGTLKAVK